MNTKPLICFSVIHYHLSLLKIKFFLLVHIFSSFYLQWYDMIQISYMIDADYTPRNPIFGIQNWRTDGFRTPTLSDFKNPWILYQLEHWKYFNVKTAAMLFIPCFIAQTEQKSNSAKV